MPGDYERIRKAIEFIDAHAHEQPSLERIAAHAGLSPFHFQRLFRRWAGTSPKRFLEYLTTVRARRLLEGSASVLDAALEVGLSGPGRLHDHFVTLEAVTPGEVRSRGAALAIRYGVHPGPFGETLIAATERGICFLAFVEAADREAEMDDFCRRWPGARLIHDQAATERLARRIFARGPSDPPLPLCVRGTNFQVNVWRALLRIPPGTVASYQAVAQAAGRPGAIRAAANAVAANPVAFLIPCHRVLRSTGDIGGYRWGPERKRVILAWEAARAGVTPVRTTPASRAGARLRR
jgi:AraC family transcriptional regulator of adaptative response/methylated-DNA-[protein]-cysteine methyltransferase